MKKVVFVSENRVLIECLTSLVNSNEVLDIQLLSTTRIYEAGEDIVDFKADIVIVDVMSENITESVTALLNRLQASEGIIKLLLLTEERKQSVIKFLADEYVIYDEQLEQLFIKLAEYRDI